MDPRPVQFAYRRPRPSNLTYQSYGASQSLMHVGAYSKRYELPNYSTATNVRHRDLPDPENIQNHYNSRWKLKDSEMNSSYIYPMESQYKSSFNEDSAKQINNERMSKSLVFDDNRGEKGSNNGPSLGMPSNRSQLLNQKDSLTKWTSSLTSKRHLEGQDKVYEYQQKPYDILNMQPKIQPNGHRIYPRFSLQHKMVPRFSNAA